MRRVNITKQDIVKPKAVLFGLTVKQMVIMGTGLLSALGVFSLLYFVLNWNIDIILILVFIILAIFAMGSIMRVNGISGISWIIMVFKGPITRNYQSKGVNDFYDIQKEISKK